MAIVGEIRLFPYSRLVNNWMECKGQLLSISDNLDLSALLGTQYGGDGKETFALPNLRGKDPIKSEIKYYICIDGSLPTRDSIPEEDYMSRIRIFPFGFAPKGWMRCDGKELEIQKNFELYNLLRTRYGGDGVYKFALPNLIEEGKQLDSGINYYIFTNEYGKHPKYPKENSVSNDKNISYLGEIDMFALTYAPEGWKTCQGQTLEIRKNEALYSLLGTKFGGDIKYQTFELPYLPKISYETKIPYTIMVDSDARYPYFSDEKIGDLRYIGEIKLFPCTFIAKGWAVCEGQLLKIEDYRNLYDLIGTQYGGNGEDSFALPNLVGKELIREDTRYCIRIEGDCPKKDVEGGNEYISRIGIFPYEFAPKGWMLCDGKKLEVQGNHALYSLLKNRYGGEKYETFVLPNLIEEGKLLGSNIHYYIYNGDEGIYPTKNRELNSSIYYDDIGPYYIGEIDMFAVIDVPKNWEKCDGTILKYDDNKELASLLGNIFGGSFKEKPYTFALPNLEKISEETKLLYAMPSNNAENPIASNTKEIRYLGEIRLFPYTYIPEGWEECKGQALLIAQYPELFSLLGIRYGGDGRVTFNLPNMSGLEPIPHMRYCIYIGSSNKVYPKKGIKGMGADIKMRIYLSEVRLFPYGFAPKGWALCDGRKLEIKKNPELYGALRNRYGGDGKKTFALPNLMKDNLLSGMNYYIFIGNGFFPYRNDGYLIFSYVGEIALFALDYAPSYDQSLQCNGDLVAISKHTSLFSLIGTEFGGDARTTFRLPDLRHVSKVMNLKYAIWTDNEYWPNKDNMLQ